MEHTLIETMRYLGIEHDDAADSVKMNRVNDVARYFGQFDDGMNVLRTVATKLPKASRVDGIWEYMTMRKEHDELKSDLATLEPTVNEKRAKLKSLKRTLEHLE